MIRKLVSVALLAIAVLGPSRAMAADEGIGHKEFKLDIGDVVFDTGTRSENFAVTATGPFKDDGSPAVGATEWLSFSLWDYAGGAWRRVFPSSVPDACPSCTTWTVPPGGVESRRLNGTRFRAFVIHRGATPADSTGALLDWWKD